MHILVLIVELPSSHSRPHASWVSGTEGPIFYQRLLIKVAFKSEHTKMSDVCGCPHSVGKVDNIPAALREHFSSAFPGFTLHRASLTPTNFCFSWLILPSQHFHKCYRQDTVSIPSSQGDVLHRERFTWTTLNSLSRARPLAPAYYGIHWWYPVTSPSSSFSSTMSLSHSSVFLQCPSFFILSFISFSSFIHFPRTEINDYSSFAKTLLFPPSEIAKNLLS